MAASRFTLVRRVEFADTDAAGIMHFSNFFRFMEETEHAFYRSLGFSVHPLKPVDGENHRIGWPRVHASADFRLPLDFEEEVEIELLVEEVRDKTIRYLFRFWKNPREEDARAMAAEGRFTVVCVVFDESMGKMKAVAMPGGIREKMEPASAELLVSSA